MPSLKWMVQQGRPRVFGIYKRVTSIGRAGANDVSIDSDSWEAHHAQLVFDGRDFALAPVDPGATFQVNGRRKKKSKIFHNDRLTLGDVELVFSLYDEGSSRDPDVEGRASQTSEIEGMVKLSDFNRRLLEIRAIPDQIEALLDAVIDIVHANTGKFLPFFWICVSKRSYEVWITRLDPVFYATGRRWYQDVLSLWAQHNTEVVSAAE